MAMLLKDVDITKLSQGMKQYVDFKLKHKDKIVFFRLGDFYEMFFDDAYVASEVLNLTLTGKDCGLEERAPMCGVPFHACETYIKKLIENGYNVVICEQMEDPAQAKGIVKRDVIRIVTPGTLIESDLLDEGSNNWLASVYISGSDAYVCMADMSTGEAHLFRVTGRDTERQIIDLLARFSPAEIICQPSFTAPGPIISFVRDKLKTGVSVLKEKEFDPIYRREDILRQFSAESFKSIGLSDEDPALCAVAALCGYIRDTQCVGVSRFSSLTQHDGEQVMNLGYTARTNLEIVRTMRTGEKKGSLLWVLDRTKTSMGKRMLRSFVEQPLLSPFRIMQRLDAVEELTESGSELGSICDSLSGVYDLERLMTRVMYKTASPHDIRALCATAKKLPEIKEILGGMKSQLLKELNSEIDPLTDIYELTDRAIVEDPPSTYKEGGVIRDGYSEELDKLRDIKNNGEGIIQEIVERERDRTGIRNLKIGYNRVFGYYIEVTRSYYELVPPDYIRKQTLANAERFVTEELKNTEEMILGASERISALEAELFAGVRDFIADRMQTVQRTAVSLAVLDVLCSFAQTALSNNYVKPDIAIDGVINIKNGRHPVVELTLKDEVFVPNDTYLDLSSNRMAIITGPNMSGKSTYMRQVALIVLMAQIGSFVPADYAKISVVDQIFTRVGASDDLTAGQSTFMVEMSEVAEIVRHATKNSLVVLDEVGRGTSTFDGISIARSVAEYIADPKLIGCKTLFATHYHELIGLEGEVDGVLNYSVAVKRSGDGVRFLRKIVRGGVDESYGIEVAKLAGLPPKLINRAKTILSGLETKAPAAKREESGQVSFETINDSAAISKLKKTNIDELSDKELRELIEDIISNV